MTDWNSSQYLKFSAERTQPAIDLANRIRVETPGKIADIGCGPGNSTEVLLRRFPGAEVLGADSSQEMIEAAKRNLPGLEFRLCDAGRELSALGGDFGIVFSNACIQWIPNHQKLLRGMMNLLRPGGVLAVQTPMNQEEPIHRIIGEVVGSEKWTSRFPNPRIFHNLTQGEYFDLLSELSSDFTMWQTTYFHRLKSLRDIMEWYRGTGLRPYLAALPEAERAEFERDVFERLEASYPEQKNGEIIFRFPRFFFLAVK
ncbi:Trans-aconitate 2-methyltransferase [Caprobacter fermentans]|uniref:Trans-aconitate 2-methyltransferase n=1 Tax=Caproicibacter fermentans TaxID=2576756 RepID=A0A6N8I2H9_9FIRM|nr:methyltransferase domain-containing protein [Caproicibacter fermentans]MVB12169.1 Trans-aconitate 2-methyltransferase [Caproicibacter fermentans]